MDPKAWGSDALAARFVDDAYATLKGFVRTAVLHRQLLLHLPPAPATVLDVGGGAGHQSLPLAEIGYDVTLLDPSAAMLDKARARLASADEVARERVTLIEAPGQKAHAATGETQFDAVLCHGVLGYLDSPDAMVAELCSCVRPGGIVSIMTGNARAMALRPALEGRWADALAAFDGESEVGVLGVPTRADTVESMSELLRRGGVEPAAWYAVWLFADLWEFGGGAIPDDRAQWPAIAEVEFEAGRRDPYRQLSRVFHLVGRRI
jgi:2-polyprenyl-3-methyl-5-hydroxy-6-metoxy-1,4-benzoquinol methylase